MGHRDPIIGSIGQGVGGLQGTDSYPVNESIYICIWVALAKIHIIQYNWENVWTSGNINNGEGGQAAIL